MVRKELKPKHLQEKVVTYFWICVGFRVRRTTFQSKPQQAENLTAKREKASDMERIKNISKLRKRWKEQQGAKERQTCSMLVSVVGSATTPGGTQRVGGGEPD